MSKSSPPPSTTAPTPPASSPARRRLGARLAHALRWLHIYLSLFSFAALLFFAATGITLNHPSWFADVERRAEHAGRLDPAWLGGDASPGGPPGGGGVDELRVVEHLRAAHRIRGALADFTTDDAECAVTFKGPGYAADAFIDRESGRYTLAETSRGLVAVANDLHKGRDSGPAWSWVVDLSAAAMGLVSITGLGLLFYLRLRRVAGLVAAAVGAAVVALAYYLGVP